MTNSEYITQILGQDESERFECKRIEREPSKLLESICGMANAFGGLLVLGLEDPKKAKGSDRIYGVRSKSDNVDELMNLSRKEITPPLQVEFESISVVSREKENDRLILVRVPKSPKVHSIKRGDTFKRDGTHNHKLTAQEILRLQYQKGEASYETELTSCSLEDLDLNLLATYMKANDASGEDIMQFLKDNKLAIMEGSSLRLTKGCILVFGKNPAVSLSHKCSIKTSKFYGIMEHYTGTPNLYSKPVTLEGNLLQQIQKAIFEFKEHVRNASPVGNEGLFISSFKVPEWVFTEAVVNAVIHRDYSVPNDIQIRYYDDRVEVESPGTYPGHITATNLRAERYARNPILLRTLNRFPDSPNLDIGEGVDRMFNLMKQNNLYDPIYIPAYYKPYSVNVVLLNTQRIKQWDVVSRYIEEHGKITNSEARKITGVSDTLQMTKLLNSWVEKNLLLKNGEKKGTFYTKPGHEVV